jgi:hypothetical protein
MNQKNKNVIAFGLMWSGIGSILTAGGLLLYFLESEVKPYLGAYVGVVAFSLVIDGLLTWSIIRKRVLSKQIRIPAKFWSVLILVASIAGLIYVNPELEQAYHCNDLMNIETPVYPDPPTDRIWQRLESGYTPVTNPLKGFVAWNGVWPNFPHSMEFFYISFRSLVPGDSMTSLDLTPLNQTVNEIASRGHQAIFRIHMDYPGGGLAVPQFLVDQGVEIRQYYTEGGGYSPDYDDPRMVDAMVELIIALGEEYDGDPRIGYIQAGLLGHWGEWHTWPDSEWMANETTQQTVLSAYNEAFPNTWVVVRYPSPVTKEFRVGFHDDVFCQGTLPVRDKYDDWYFWVSMEREKITDCWKTVPIGGEMAPPIQPTVFDCPRTDAQDFYTCTKTTHASWMIFYGVFLSNYYTAGTDEYRRAERGSAVMGYDFKACWMNYTQTGNQIDLSVIIGNFGLAPFYYNWSIEFAIMDSDHNVLGTIPTDYTVDNILPEANVRWDITIPDISIYSEPSPIYALRIINPLSNGLPVIFSNEMTDATGWVYLN